MSDGQIRFEYGAAYERFMGKWSRLAGEIFLDWIAVPPGLRWIDVGCGNGAFTELLFERQRPAHVEGIDPSPAQLAFARTRLQGREASLHLGSADRLPFGDATFDAAAMALANSSFPSRKKVWRRWCASSGRAAPSPPMRGTCRVAAFRLSR